MNQAAFLYNQQYNGQMQNVCSPLEMYLGVNGFCYYKIYNNSQYVMLNNKLDVAKDILLHIDYAHIFHCKEILCTTNKAYRLLLWPDEAQSSIMEIWLKNNLWNGLIIFKPNDDYNEFWCFTAKKENSAIHDFYKTHVNVFFDFINYFNNEMQGSLEKSQHPIALFKNGFDSSLPDRRIELTQEQTSIQVFYKHITSKGFKVKSKNGLIKLTLAYTT